MITATEMAHTVRAFAAAVLEVAMDNRAAWMCTADLDLYRLHFVMLGTVHSTSSFGEFATVP
eukprot:CAMPEP_0203841452 /NCGR_PEP_ID=MMETSP0359-20131031/1398_1 /ASSEMBLY_ACC=CAM_ASM_000338 /TAXON_ID=268821 /ORGANISM="Scrippsiella Hangoei, Strain SHTV-5" /LENGTH=61 /DNA_ID=CAMNT_0050755869 /DNA_START=22 /DNA_END=203 /DNA_ORIENTATION=+